MLRGFRNQCNIIHPGCPLNLVRGILAGKTNPANVDFLAVLSRGPGQFDAGPRRSSVHFGCYGRGSVLRSEGMQLEADALVRGERSGLAPSRETIGGRRQPRNVVANPAYINFSFSTPVHPT